MVKHGALSKSHVYQLLRSKDARVRHAAFTLLEMSNPRLRRNSELFVEITRFIWHANPSYDVYHEFTKRHFQAPYKVHELVSARIKLEKQSAGADDLTHNTQHYEGGFLRRLFCRRSSRIQGARCEAQWPRGAQAQATPRLRHEPAAVLPNYRNRDRVNPADDGAGCASNERPFALDFQKRPATPNFKKAGKGRRCCLTLACRVPAG